MIYYTTTKTDCLISIRQSVANARAKFWLSAVLPKRIAKYALDLPEFERKINHYCGLPTQNLLKLSTISADKPWGKF